MKNNFYCPKVRVFCEKSVEVNFTKFDIFIVHCNCETKFIWCTWMHRDASVWNRIL